jgi:hypothetical protein
MSRAKIAGALGLAVVTCLAPPRLAAQGPGGPILQAPGGASGWLPSLGIRAGFDYRNSDPLVGAFLRLPVPITGLRPAITPGFDLVFHDDLTDRQIVVDATVDLFGGLSVGGGPLRLNTIYGDPGDPRETRLGYTLIGGFHNRGGPFGVDLDFRWVFVEDIEQPRYLMVAFTWTPGAPRRRGGGAFGN